MLDFERADDARRCAASFLSLFSSASAGISLTLTSGSVRDDLSAAEVARRVVHGAVGKLEVQLAINGNPMLFKISLSMPSEGRCFITAPYGEDARGSRLWLQQDPDVASCIPVLCMPCTAGGLALEAAHALVGLAVRSGGFICAELAGEIPLHWAKARRGEPAPALVSRYQDAVWQLVDSEDVAAGAYAWVPGVHPKVARVAPSPGWWEQYDTLLRRPDDALAELRAHLAAQFEIPFEWNISSIKDAPEGNFVVRPEVDAIAHLVPEADRVIIAIDLAQPPSKVGEVLLHLCAHLALGHVCPGDSWGHWDTVDSLSSTPRRHWDREVRAYVDAYFPRPVRKVSSLEECNPKEKAWLVLHDHIGRMIGQSRTLHAATERYQAAAYQRQAAQRLVAQLEEYGGAMLCDGVGLGKTYVATTVVVHYANLWRDQLPGAGRSPAEDPFRITVLSPNSVVSTWEREAIAPLAAHGVPLATIRVISHSKLSRIQPSSEILTRGREHISDMQHLLLSDLVIVDEAHNFRSVGARRATVLRDLLRLQPRRDLRRKVLLLTATPVNNSLEDLRQQAALMFGKPLYFNDNLTADKYRTRAFKDAEERILKAAKGKSGDVAALLIHGDASKTFGYAPDFRDDLQFGVQVPRVGDYLKEQEKRLVAQQAAVRAAIQSGQSPGDARARIAGELLDRIVVQRSRALCKQIEREQGSDARLLFRPDASAPEKLIYEDVYDDIHGRPRDSKC